MNETGRAMLVRVFCGFAVAIIAVTAMWGLGFFKTQAAGRTADGIYHFPIPNHVTTAGKQQISIVQEVDGVVKSTWSMPVESEASGVVTWVGARVGDYVEEGQVLALLDANEVRVDMDTAAKALVQAEKDLTLADRYCEEIHRQYHKGKGTDSLFEHAKARRSAAQQRYRIAKAEHEESKRLIRSRRVISPCSGLIVDSDIYVGDPVWACKALFMMVDPDYMVLEAFVPPELSQQLAVDTPVRLRLNRINSDVGGTVQEITPYSDPKKTGFLIRTTFVRVPGVADGDKGALMLWEGTKEVVTVPDNAIYPIGRRHTVLMEKEGHWVRRFVKLGREMGDEREVVAGLEGGERLGER